MDYVYTKHAEYVMEERGIKIEWVRETIDNPDMKETSEDGKLHIIRQIEEYGNRYLRVIIEPECEPKKIITVFFDRRLRRSI